MIASQAKAEAAVYGAICLEIMGESPGLYLRELKSLLTTGFNRGEWDFNPVLDAALGDKGRPVRDFYRALCDAILDPSKVPLLQEYSQYVAI